MNSGKVDAEGYYAVVGGGNPIWSEYIYSATNARLQEAHLSYTLPKSLLKTVRVTLGLTAHNLFMLYKKAPFDPESTAPQAPITRDSTTSCSPVSAPWAST